ncbi:MAG: hypothetical protein ACRBF0_00305 [Calditrichia bacterium]
MIESIRQAFIDAFDPAVYNQFIKDIHTSNQESLVFRVSESPLFLSDELTKKLISASKDVLEVLRQPGYSAQVENAIPPGMHVAGETKHTNFLQVDFAICRDANGELSPQLIELQGFPSLYSFQCYLDDKIRQYFDIPAGFTPFFSGLDSVAYHQHFSKLLLGDSDPENVVVLEIDPYKQKTRIDFYLTESFYGVKSVCLSDIIQRGRKLFYKRDNREVPIERLYHRFIFDELEKRKDITCGFNFEDDLDVTWVGHPNWFFKISKYTMPFINSPYCPECNFLSDLETWPDDLENYVLKPLFSFAGSGVIVDVDRKTLDSITDRQNFILQKKVEYEPFMKTPDEPARAEVRMMFLWDDEPILVNNLLRLSKGKMMGVDYNQNKTWVGSSLAYHHPV